MLVGHDRDLLAHLGHEQRVALLGAALDERVERRVAGAQHGLALRAEHRDGHREQRVLVLGEVDVALLAQQAEQRRAADAHVRRRLGGARADEDRHEEVHAVILDGERDGARRLEERVAQLDVVRLAWSGLGLGSGVGPGSGSGLVPGLGLG